MITLSGPIELAERLTIWRTEADVLRRHGDTSLADALTRCANDVEKAAADYLDWLTETAAMQRSGWTLTQVRSHARKFLGTEHVRVEKRAYKLRACIVPRRLHSEMLRASAERSA